MSEVVTRDSTLGLRSCGSGQRVPLFAYASPLLQGLVNISRCWTAQGSRAPPKPRKLCLNISFCSIFAFAVSWTSTYSSFPALARSYAVGECVRDHGPCEEAQFPHHCGG